MCCTCRPLMMLCALLLLPFINADAATPKQPDFAYPKTVSTQSEKNLAKAMAEADRPGIARSLMDYYLAQTAISADKSSDALSRIGEVTRKVGDPALKGVLYLLQADIYNGIYRNHRWKYDGRDIPLLPLPDDYNLWSGEQFKTKILALVDSSLVFAPQLGQVPLKSYKSVINADAQTYIYYPSLYDFVANRSITIMSGLTPGQKLFSWGLLVPRDVYVVSKFPQSDPIAARILDIYASLLRINSGKTAASLNTDISRIAFIFNRIYQNGDNPDQKLMALLRSLYEENVASEYSGDVLCFIAERCPDCDPKWFYASLNSNITRYPNYWRKNCLLNAKNSLSVKTVRVDIPWSVSPEKSAKIDIELGNLNSVALNIYDVSSAPIYDNNVRLKDASSRKLVTTLKVTAGGDVPFTASASVEYKFPQAGNYIIVPVIDGVEQADRSFTKVHVTHYALGSSSFKDRKLWVVDAMTGKPVDAARLTVYKDVNHYRRKPAPVAIGETSDDGSRIFSETGSAVAEKNGDKYAQPLYVYDYRERQDDKWQPSAAGFSSLPLYHPGDTVMWTAVCYEFKGKEQRPRRGVEINAVMRDASYNPVDTLVEETDTYGRVHGKFLIPKDCLTGHFMISVDNYSSAVEFEVSDYKLPTFHVELQPVEKNYPSTGDVTIRGKAVTYSGFPLADAKVTMVMSVSQRMRWWWNRSKGISFNSKEVTTGPDGSFEVSVDSTTLSVAPIPDGVFTAGVSVLSASGETQTASATFVTGTKYDIRVSLPEAIEIGNGVTHIAADVVNYQDSVISLPINYVVKRDSAVVVRGTMLPADRNIDFRSLPSGEYQLIFLLEDAGLADEYTASTVIYRRDDISTPVPGRLLWYPSNSVVIKGDRSGEWLYATDCDTYLLVTVWTSDDIISQKWVKSPAGMHTLDVQLPDSVDNATVSVSATGAYRRAAADINVKRSGREKGIKFITESFRDRLTPGSDETWTFRVVDNTGDGKKAAVILDMYNTALDALATQNWKLSFHNGSTRRFNFYANDPGNISSAYYSKYSRNKSCPALVNPGFDTYGRSFVDGVDGVFNTVEQVSAGMRIRGVANYKSMKMAASKTMEEEAVEVAADEAVSAMPGDLDAGASEAGIVTGDANAVPKEKDFSYRQSEVPLAFFSPALTTDANGNLTFAFTVPDANTTWGFRAVAYTDSLLSTDFSADVLANKPVMVQPNLPRFLRSGDKAHVLANVMNGSGEEQVVTTKVEIFNPSDGDVLSEHTVIDTVAPSATTTVAVMIDTPADGAFIGYRVKSSAGSFADGEQTLIPVLPATTPVIETYPFYISPDTLEFSMELPTVPSDAKVSLQFCENPIWYVVTALPGLLDFEPSTANQAAAAIFSASIATGILRDNPMIAEALKEWERSDKSDGTLTSMLERNEDLKIMLLSSTPWMLDAKSDTERMTRLALLFDKKTVEKAYTAAINLLKRLECDGGGWAWYTRGEEPSQWVTENILLMMGRLRSLGYLPADKSLLKMILNAISYIDKEVARQYRKYPATADYTAYIYMRDYFKGFTSTGGASAAINATVQNILRKWNKTSIFDKAVYARILKNHGYQSVAKRILASLREYSESTPEKGMWWPSLDNMTMWSMGKVGTTAVVLEAFAAVEPGCVDIDKIRQWLILQKEAMDWGSSVTTSATIAAILSTSGKWVKPSAEATVSVDDSVISPAAVERMTGYFRVPLSAPVVSGKELRVIKGEGTPSWGAVFCQYTDSITDVKESSCDAISIRKSIYKEAPGVAGVSVETIDSLNVGDRIKVTLTLEVERDMDYVAIVDDRPACYEPVEQLPKPIVAEGIYFYRENRNASTRFFITHLPKGTYILTYDMWVNNAGVFTSGIATVQSQYAPQLSAHSAGGMLKVLK